MKIKKFNLIYFSFLLIFFLFLFNKVNAQSILPLIVSPARQEILINPGEKTIINVSFLNQGSSPLSGIIKAADFIVDNPEGIPNIIDNAGQASPKFSASTWVTLQSDKLTIAEKDKATIPVVINVPKEAKPGGRYLAIYFEPQGVVPSKIGAIQEAGSGTAIRLASLAYIRVSGDITEKAIISRFFAKPFNEYGPIKIESDILNRGDYHIRPKSVIAITNAFGSVIAQSKLKEENIFPDQTRTFFTEIGPKWLIGRYKLSLTSSYGEKGQAITGSLFVWVFPWRIALIIVLSIIILILIIKGLSKKAGKRSDVLEKELQIEKEEIERLKAQLKNRE